MFVKEMNYLKKAFKCVILLCSTKPESTGCSFKYITKNKYA